MSPERSCSGMEEALTEALLARRPLSANDEAHAEACPECRLLQRKFHDLAIALEASPDREPSRELVARTLERAVRELASSPARVPTLATLPQGFGRELARLLGGALVPLPLVLGWNFLILLSGAELLSAWLPGSLLTALGVAYTAAAAGWLALFYGALPLLAHRDVRRRLSEALT